MIQEFGAEHAYDNHFEPLSRPGERDHLHFSPSGCLARVGRAAHEVFDAAPRGLPASAGPGDLPVLARGGALLPGARRLRGRSGGLCLRVGELAAPRRAAASPLCRRDRPRSSTAGIATTGSAGAAARPPSWRRAAARSCAPSAPRSPTPRSARASSAPWPGSPTIPPTTRSCSRATRADDGALGAGRRLHRDRGAARGHGATRGDGGGRPARQNLRFYKSQPWSFTDTLMVGFWCEVDGDAQITVDRSELREARWFTRAEIPLERTGDRASMTGEMIERFRVMGRGAWA